MDPDLRPTFPRVNPVKLAMRLRELPVIGKPIAPKRSHSCRICRRSIGPHGILVTPGFPICQDDACQVTRVSDATKHFTTPYGKAVDRAALRVFATTVELDDGRIVVCKAPIHTRAQHLAEGFAELIEWQKAFDELEWFQNPNDYADGIITLVPPRRIEDVLVLRARMMPICRDLLASFDPETAALLRRVKDEGVTALETPF